MDEITILDKTYISSKRAAEITGYAKDYVGQLCREGHVDAKMVGRSWYVYEPSIRQHRFGEVPVVAEAAQPEPEVVEEVKAAAPVEPEVPVWESSSVYKAESVDLIPELEAPVVAPYVPVSAAETITADTHATLTDMQSAWREWFDRKQMVQIEAPEPELSLPSAYDEDELLLEESEALNENEFVIPIHKIEEDAEEEEVEEVYEEAASDFVVPIQRMTRVEPMAAPVMAPVRGSVPEYVPVAAARREVVAEPQGVIRKEKIVKHKKMKRTKAGKRGTRTNAPIIAGLIAVAMISIAIAAIGTGYAERYLSGHVVNNPVVNFLVGDSKFKR
jgi:hypothetical protein